MSNRLRDLIRDDRGATLVEFAFVAPVFLLFVMGAFEFGHQVYAQAMLQGSIQKAARDAGIESGKANRTAIDDHVKQDLADLLPSATVTFDRKNYETFSNVGAPEDYTDSNSNNVYDTGECFTDMNGNSRWDSDMGSSGLGGADDVVSYTVTAQYNRLFPLWSMVGMASTATITANTILRTQPYGTQAERTGIQICP